jgi:hypothetical protein
MHKDMCQEKIGKNNVSRIPKCQVSSHWVSSYDPQTISMADMYMQSLYIYIYIYIYNFSESSQTLSSTLMILSVIGLNKTII